VIFYENGVLGCRYVRATIEAAATAMGKPLPQELKEALDYFDALARRSDILFDCMLDPGEITLMNNKTVLHGRTAFKDDEDPAKRRHLMRLWIDAPIGSPGVADTEENAPGRGGIAMQQGKMPSFNYEEHGVKPTRRIA
jgi:hypothetical protein